MKISTFRILLTVSWVGLIGLAVADVLLESTLPPELRTYVEANAAATEFAITDLTLIAVGCVWVVAIAASYVGLYRLRRWGRTLFLWTVVAAFPINLLWQSPVVLPAPMWMLYSAWNILDGVLLATVYLVPSISGRFDPPPATESPAD